MPRPNFPTGHERDWPRASQSPIESTAGDLPVRPRLEQELKPARVAADLREDVQRYSFLADTVPLILWTARPDGGLDYYNKAWFDYTGLTLAQTGEWGWEAVLHPDDLQPCLDRWKHSCTTGVGYEIEYRFKRAADGAYRWFLGRASARRNDAGEIVQWVGTATDIDDQKRANAEMENRVAERTAEVAKSNEVLRRQQTELRVLFDLMPAMIWFKDTEDRILRVNRRAAEAAGKPVEAIEGQLSADTYPQDAARYFADDLEVIRSGAPKLGIVETFRGAAGQELWVETDKVPVCDPDGKVIGIVVMAQDITERKRTEEALRLLNSAVLQARESIMITDAQLDLPGPRILFVNPAFTRMTGYPTEEVIGKTPRILQGARTDRTVLSRLRQDLERGDGFEGETINYRKDGTEFNLEWQIAPIRGPGGTITHFVAIQRDVTARMQTESALRASNEKFRQLADNIVDAFWIRSPDMHQVHYVSPAFERIWGRSVESLYANPERWTDFIFPEDRERVRSAFGALTRSAPSLDIKYRIVRPDGTIRWVQVRGFQVRDAADQLLRHTGIVTDITERRLLEDQLLQSQKMETVGKLAGGMAHEFNNIMTAIIGQSELLLSDLAPRSPLCGNVIEIRKAAERAATLTRQLLAYGRRQILQPKTLELNAVLAGMAGTLRHMLGGSVDLILVPAPGLMAVHADATQLEQVVMNVARNAAEAMPNGGKLTLATANIFMNQESAGRFPEARPGNYVMLAITDTGAGMSEEVKARAFEPFFTTKGIGKGPGLGLSTSYGIIKQSGGFIGVESEPGQGTTLTIYLPAVEPPAMVPVPRLDSPEMPSGAETILLVEPDPALREMAATLLRRLGYTVLAAADGRDALRLASEGDSKLIDLLFSDVTLPDMSGEELAGRMHASSPRIRILFSSAYTDVVPENRDRSGRNAMYLQKPFTPSALARKLRDVFEPPAASTPAAA